jgi:hypothetical protein
MCLVLIPFGLWVLWTAYRPVSAEPLDVDVDSSDVSSDAVSSDMSDTSQDGGVTAGMADALDGERESEGHPPS